MLRVLYYDKDLIVCIKPVGISSELTQDDKNMPCLISEYLQTKKININKYNIGIVHRLDRAVGGVMVYALNKYAASKLSVQIANRVFIKEYIAIIHNIPQEPQGLMKDLLFKDSSKNKSFVVNKIRKGVKEAILEYKLVSSKELENKNISLVKIKLHTGRTHQIRVQFSSRKMPLLCDKKYGSRNFDGNICLWSYKVIFSHPISNNRLEFEALPDMNTLYWNYFNNVIKKL